MAGAGTAQDSPFYYHALLPCRVSLFHRVCRLCGVRYVILLVRSLFCILFGSSSCGYYWLFLFSSVVSVFFPGLFFVVISFIRR